jgi:peptide deformylase
MIHELNNALLKEIMPKFDFINPPTDPIQLARDLVETMMLNNGMGLSANQLGLPYRAFSLRTGSPMLVMFNPKVVDINTELTYMDEGCLSFPNLIVPVKRPTAIRVRYTLPNGVTEMKKFTGLTARTILHELDHLDGLLFYDRATKFHRDRAFKKWKKKK